MVSTAVEHFPSRAKRFESTLGQRIRMARRSAGLSQATLAARSSVTASAVAQWEHPSGTRPTLDRLKIVARALGVPLDWLVEGGRRNAVTPPVGRDPEPPALVLDVYAQTLQEEQLLAAYRRMNHRAREHLLALAQEFSPPRRRAGLQPR